MTLDIARAGADSWANDRAVAFGSAFAIAMPIVYTICEMANVPMFTYHPGTGQLNWGWAPAVKENGPAMYWYGWVAASLTGATALGVAASFAPRFFSRAAVLHLGWVVSLLVLPLLFYSLRFYWRW